MKILFVTFGEVSVGRGGVRSTAVLRALADAGHQVDVLSARCGLSSHLKVCCLNECCSVSVSPRRLKLQILKAISGNSYDVVHAVDEAACSVARICRLKKVPFIYDAVRCLTGAVGRPPSKRWMLFSRHFSRLEKKTISLARYVLSPSDTLSADLRSLVPDAEICQIEDAPIQSLISGKEMDAAFLEKRVKDPVSSWVVCCVLPGSLKEMKKLLMAARKVVEVVPRVAFVFRGTRTDECRQMAANLDIEERCIFLEDKETVEFLAALEHADAVLLLSGRRERYIHPEVFTLLNSSAPLIAVQDSAYSDLLSDKNSIQVLSSTDSITEGVLRVIQEPLFSVQLATEGQQLIADHYSFSSFKHKIRMLYHEVLNKE
jgi:glycosyltransferase involved in cell wall biosynthesis